MKDMTHPLKADIIHKSDIQIVYELLETPYSWDKSPFNHEEFVCLLVVNDDNIDNETQNYISDKLIDYGCKYAVCTGNSCSTWEDAIDWSYLAKYKFAPSDKDSVMTTSHKNESVEDFVFYFIQCTNLSNHHFKNFLVLFIGSNEELKKKVISEVHKNM